MGLFGKSDPRPTQDNPTPSASQPSQSVAPPPSPKPPSKGTVMGEKTRYTGKIETDEPLLIFGHVDGEIKSTSEVEIGDSGNVKATISAKSIVISGKVTGDCAAADRLEIRASGRLTGSIKAARIAITDGAEFKGTSQTTSGGKS